MTIDERFKRLKELEEELRTTKYNKRTEHAIGLLKAKIARLREEIEKERKKARKKGKGFSIKKTGDATVVLVGFPSVGKSTLLNKLTNAKSKVGAYDFTTLNTIPGTMEYENAKIQIIDIPGLILGASTGSGRGKEVLSAVRVADLIVIVTTPNSNIRELKSIIKELWNVGIRLNKKKPDVRIKKKPFGGISIASTEKLDFDQKTIMDILKEFKIMNADILIREKVTLEEFIDTLQENIVYIPAIFVMNKIDLITRTEFERIKKEFKEQGIDIIGVSAEKGINIEELKNKIFEKLNLVRIYLKEINKKPDFEKPLIIKGDKNKEVTIRSVCERIHKDFIKKFRFARVWGSSKFPGQKVGLDYKVKDKDIVQIHLR